MTDNVRPSAESAQEKFGLDPAEGRERKLARVEAAVRIVRMRDLRDRMLGQTVNFADPAWDLLLDLYVAELRGPRLSVSDACVGARVPATTALRWLDHLYKARAIERIPDPRDKRRVILQLTPTQLGQLNAFFDALITSSSSSDSNPNRASIRPEG